MLTKTEAGKLIRIEEEKVAIKRDALNAACKARRQAEAEFEEAKKKAVAAYLIYDAIQ